MPPAEDSKVTDSLFGTTFAHASQIKGLDGDEVILYVFAVRLSFRPAGQYDILIVDQDLSVRTEGL